MERQNSEVDKEMRDKIVNILRQQISEYLDHDLPALLYKELSNKILVLFVKREKQFQILLEDTTDDDTAIRNLAGKVLPNEKVDGDNYGVPTIVDIVKWLVNKIEQLPSLDGIVVEEKCLNIKNFTNIEDHNIHCIYCHGTGTITRPAEWGDIIELVLFILKRGQDDWIIDRVCYDTLKKCYYFILQSGGRLGVKE